MAKKYGKSRRGSRKAGRKTRKAQRGGDENMNVSECTAKYMRYKKAGQNVSEFKEKYPQCKGKVNINSA
jgi:hypothetical protein